MKYSVYQHWDPLKVCIVGRSYSPEFYSFIKNSKARSVMERIARETEEDYQKLIQLLESFNVEVLRPDVTDNYSDYLLLDNKISIPPMFPCDHSIMVGETFYHNWINEHYMYNKIKADHWPEISSQEEFDLSDEIIKHEVSNQLKIFPSHAYAQIIEKIKSNGNVIRDWAAGSVYSSIVNRAMITRAGKDLYLGTYEYQESDIRSVIELFEKNYRTHCVHLSGHGDGTYCPVVPGLIISLKDIPTYKDTFPGWEVIYLPDQSWKKVKPFLDLKEKNRGKWWVPGEELNDDFTDFVEEWLGHWVGYVEETVFDVNMLVIDRHNVVCNNYNKEVFDAFERHGVTPHIVNFRHRYFWDGGLHCITSDVHREGTMQDYFPERG